MNNVKRLAKNSGASFLAQISTPAASFVLVFFIARSLGVSGLGVFSSSLAFFYIFQAIATLGLQQLITRNVAQDKSKAGKYLINSSIIVLLFSTIIAGIMCLVVNITTDSVDTISAVYILSIALIPSTLALVSESISRAFEKLEYITISIIAQNTFKVLAGLFVLFNDYGLIYLIVVILISYFINFVLSLFFAIKFVPKPIYKSCKIDFAFCVFIISATPVFALIMMFSTIRLNVDVLILNNMLGVDDVGFYSAAFKLVNISKLSISCYIMALQPIIFRLYKSSIDKFEIICKESIRYVFILILPIIFGTTILSDKLILIVYKQDFLPSATVLCILIWILILFGLNQIFNIILIASNNQKINLQANIIGMFTNIFLNLLLIPLFRFNGAGIANVLAALFVLIYQYRFVQKRLFNVEYIQYIKKPFVASVLMGIVVYFFKEHNIFLVVLFSSAAYLIFLIVIKTFKSKDLALVSRLFQY